LRLEYRDQGSSTARLLWSGASTPKAVVPMTQLYRLGTAPIGGGWLDENIGSAVPGSVQSTGGSTFMLRSGTVSGVTLTLVATADAYVRDGSYAAQNFGQGMSLEVKNVGAPGYSRESYLLF